MFWWMCMAALAWPLRGPDFKPTGERVAPTSLMARSELPAGALLSEPAALGRVARHTLAWMDANLSPESEHAGVLGPLGVSPADVRRTLELVASSAEQHPERLSDPAWVAAHFQAWRWTGDAEMAQRKKGLTLSQGRIRLTRYLVYRTQGSATRSERLGYALYAPPADDALRTRFTRSEVLAGAYEPGGAAAGAARPLVWLARHSVHDAIMQGTLAVKLGADTRLFNVHKVNEIPYDRSQSDPEKQDRYWYFREVEAVGGWGSDDKIGLEPWVSVAGDVANLGLGQLIALEVPGGLRLVLLADTGGAFQPNLYQLDLFTGAYDSKAAFRAATSGLPQQVAAWVLIAR